MPSWTSSLCARLAFPSSPSWRWELSEKTASASSTSTWSSASESPSPSSSGSRSVSGSNWSGGAGAFGGTGPARPAVIVDDGIATGSTARAACQVARAHGAARVVLAVPVAPRAAIPGLSSVADEVVCLETPDRFMAIGQWYSDFSQTSDEEVVALLRRAAMPGTVGTPAAPTAKTTPGTLDTAGTDTVGTDEDVEVIAGSARLAGHLSVPPAAARIVVFVHGSGSSRRSPRHQLVGAGRRP